MPPRPPRNLATALVLALRPRQWVKNLLVLAAPVAAARIDERDVLVDTVAAFVAFCLASSATYVLNDLLDVESDRRHPTKRNRPIASGVLPVPVAVALGIALLVASLVVAFATTADLGITVVAYVLLTTAYTLRLKDVAVVDLVAVAAGFVLRAVAGATATGVPLSGWFVIVTSAGALFMVSGKREGEADELGDDAALIRPTLGIYTTSFLTYLRATSSAVVLVAYCLWAFEQAGTGLGADGRGDVPTAIWYQLSIVPFAVAILRYALLADQGRAAEPERAVLADRPLLVAALAWAAIYAYAVYAH
jgi:decaprenyl-phosphate phosphoribosyltransferase